MFATDDTIAAIATPAGRGALGVIRLSGPCALEIAARVLERGASLAPRHATFTRVTSDDDSKRPLDEVVATFFQAPHSYTGEHIVEITTHGSPVVLQAVLRRTLAAGARLAEPGEFTLRAFLGGKRDLVQAEAVADLINAATPLQARVAFDQLEGTLTQRIAQIDEGLFDLVARLEASLDFPDEGYHFVDEPHLAKTIAHLTQRIDALLADAENGRMIREGVTVVIAGRTNVGKSSLFNKLSGSDRAIVTSIPGTTRDLVTEVLDIEGIAVSLVDTAGWRQTEDLVEREGVARAERARGVADLIVLVLDNSAALTEDDRQLLHETAGGRRVVALNKSDVGRRIRRVDDAGVSVEVSAVSGEGLDVLRKTIASALCGGEQLRDAAAISNTRHIALLEGCRASLESARQAAERGGVPEEFLLIDLQAARQRLDEVVGRRTSEDVLHRIFERFCIGK